MVLVKNPKEQGKGKWYYCVGKAADAQYVPKQEEGDLAEQGSLMYISLLPLQMK